MDTSDIPVLILDTDPNSDTYNQMIADPEYQKKVNDRVNEFNGEVTAWIIASAEDIVPSNIAQKLVDDLVSKGISATRVEGTVCITDSRIKNVTGDDEGDGTLLRAVGNTIESPDLVSSIHYAGKLVKVRPKHSNGDDAYYLKAVPKVDGATGFTHVNWIEAAGYQMQPLDVFVLGTVQGGTLYLAGSAAKLSELTGGSHPTFKPNAVGDDITCPLPQMFGRGINYLGMFQDRLVIGSGAVLLLSRPGDYFNWFRKSVLTVEDDDPWEGFALGAEDDTITASTTYDRNLVLHGQRFWYQINGRQPFTPKTASIVTGSAYKDANSAPPKESGNYTFYAKYSGQAGKEFSSLHQVQAGVVADNPESYEASQQLDEYLAGKPVEIVPVESPNIVFLRTESYRNGLYTYGYLDTASASERLLDNWSRWVWDARVGYTIGMSKAGSDLMVYMVKQGSGQCWVSAERFSLRSDLSDYPYADSLRPLAAATAGYLVADDPAVDDAIVAFAKGSPYEFLGSTMADRGALIAALPGHDADLWTGFEFPAFVTPTNPYIQDRNDRSILSGRLTLGRVSISVADTGGATVEVKTPTGDKTVTDFSGRLLGRLAATIGKQPIVTTAITATVGKEVRECSYTIRAKNWLPLTVTAIEWTGQFFNNVRRV